MRATIVVLALALTVLSGCPTAPPQTVPPAPQAGPAQTEEDKNMDFVLTSTAFDSGQPIPPQYTGDGADQSPPLQWQGVPEGTQELALIIEDPDAPGGDFVHWIAYGMSPGQRELAEGLGPRAEGMLQGRNDFGTVGYRGPKPPPGQVHRYRFRLLALRQPTNLKPDAVKTGFREAVAGRVEAEAELVGTYQR